MQNEFVSAALIRGPGKGHSYQNDRRIKGKSNDRAECSFTDGVDVFLECIRREAVYSRDVQ